MRSRLVGLAGLALMLAALVVPMYAGSSVPSDLHIAITEDGYGAATWGGVNHPLPGSIIGGALAFQLPFFGNFGTRGFDIAITAPEGGYYSDALRLVDIGTTSYIFYFSDNLGIPDGYPPAPADTGIGALNPGFITVPESGSEGHETGFYIESSYTGYATIAGESDRFIPEIDPGSAMSALALLSGTLLMIRGSRKK